MIAILFDMKFSRNRKWNIIALETVSACVP
jgi:hypothetical protein